MFEDVSSKAVKRFLILGILLLSSSPVLAESLQQRVQNVCGKDPSLCGYIGFTSGIMGMCEAVAMDGFKLSGLNALIQRAYDAASDADKVLIRQGVDFAADDCSQSWNITIERPQ
ncbi:hypothetical protein [Synechococcus sp. CC9616]|uniref:hypothetical protein n=1 Tax=Synechococcus sp. CC9616 TaxID=110663 RepID=UPI00048F63B4|nr:hypothetical protein [Synechococcus sp. CC9616]